MLLLTRIEVPSLSQCDGSKFCLSVSCSVPRRSLPTVEGLPTVEAPPWLLSTPYLPPPSALCPGCTRLCPLCLSALWRHPQLAPPNLLRPAPVLCRVFFSFFNIYLFIWLHQVLVALLGSSIFMATCGIFILLFYFFQIVNVLLFYF